MSSGYSGAYLEPNDDKIPEPYHAEFCGTVTLPCLRVLDCHHVHEVQDELEGKDAKYESHKIPE